MRTDIFDASSYAWREWSYDIAQCLLPMLYWTPHFIPTKQEQAEDMKRYLVHIIETCIGLNATKSRVYTYVSLRHSSIPYIPLIPQYYNFISFHSLNQLYLICCYSYQFVEQYSS